MVTRTLLIPALLLLCSCTEPLVTGDYLGEPLMKLEGRIYMDSRATNTNLLRDVDLRVAVFWTQDVGGLSLRNGNGSVVEQQVVTRASFPARYDITLYRPPAQSALQNVPMGYGRIGVALPLLYWDDNANGRWDRNTEELAGGTDAYVLLYADGEVGSSLLGGRLSSGYHLMRLGSGGEACLDGAQLALMQRSSNTTLIDLTVTDGLGELLPDADCDGFADICESILREAESIDPELREGLYAEWERCVADIYNSDGPFQTCQELIALADAGVFLDQHELEYLARCREDPDLNLVDPGLVCPQLFDFIQSTCREDANQGCIDDEIFVYEVCLDGPALQYCALETQLDVNDLNEEQLMRLAQCLVVTLPDGPNPEECLATAHEACAPIIADYDNRQVPDQVWFDYERCVEEATLQCGPPQDDCQELFFGIEQCQDSRCFYDHMEFLRECRGGILFPEDAHLCEWWLWMPEACGDQVCGDEAYEACLIEFGSMTPDPNGTNNPVDPDRQQRCEETCRLWREAGEQDPNGEFAAELDACLQDLGDTFSC